MHSPIDELVEISRYYGKQKEFVIAGGGNTSWKNDRHLYIKASGVGLADITESGFCVLDRVRLEAISAMNFSEDPVSREEQVKNALLNCRINPESGLRPSVETSLHNLFSYSFVVHTHPTVVNALMCSRDAEQETIRLFGDKVLFIPYTDPGFILFSLVRDKIADYKDKQGHDPQVVFIQNHGIFVAANSVDEIRGIYAGVITGIKSCFSELPDLSPDEAPEMMTTILPAVRMMLSDSRLKLARFFSNPMIRSLVADPEAFESVSVPFTPDQVVYCLSGYLYINQTGSSDAITREIRQKSAEYLSLNGVMPKVIFIRNLGVIVADDSAGALDYLHDLVLDFCQISVLSRNFGGPHPMTSAQISFIESWEVENYRKKVARGSVRYGRLDNKVVVITGAAQGFGAGIAEMLYGEGASVVIADLNEEKGKPFAGRLNSMGAMNRALFVPVNVADAASVKQMVRDCVLFFGGLDVMISNAGILRAGGLEEMTPETFELMTRVNYTGYFHCAKYASEVMKIQNRFHPDHFMDIIQINSKSGLKGSNKNFAYAGGKFGGIGLTQSFALELMPFRIKVNSICPGNYFEGPLWSDPENGLFIQYLKAGKIPGARSVEDVKRHYEMQVPAGRGCTPADVVKAILYVTEQVYETGQAVPVTGGQEMLR
jgi:NAD(P)-dependent dehydrogenase (short-subunit alcohol dehydrogenase family)/rhamnose utilization protein RhaD (predicted bifunctional aldolase and dehydrogenase)